MRRPLIGFALCAVLVIVLYLRQQPETGDVHERQFLAMGTLITVTVASEPGLTTDRIVEAINAVESGMHAFDRRWRPDGEGMLSEINQSLASQQSADLPDGMGPVMEQAQQLSIQSDGRFDPGIGALISLWRFNDEENYPQAPPPADDISKLLEARHSIRNLRLEDERIVAEVPLKLDFGAYAKGLALAEAMQTLESHGVHHAIINAGGDLIARGHRGDRAWRIGIRHPRAAEAGSRILAALEPEGEAVVTSGDYERFFETEDNRYHHLLDPATGYPAPGTQSLTVVHADAALADAASTALFVAGADHWRELAHRLGVRDVMRVDASGRIEVTQSLAARIHFPGIDDGLVSVVP